MSPLPPNQPSYLPHPPLPFPLILFPLPPPLHHPLPHPKIPPHMLPLSRPIQNPHPHPHHHNRQPSLLQTSQSQSLLHLPHHLGMPPNIHITSQNPKPLIHRPIPFAPSPRFNIPVVHARCKPVLYQTYSWERRVQVEKLVKDIEEIRGNVGVA